MLRIYPAHFCRHGVCFLPLRCRPSPPTSLTVQTTRSQMSPAIATNAAAITPVPAETMGAPFVVLAASDAEVVDGALTR